MTENVPENVYRNTSDNKFQSLACSLLSDKIGNVIPLFKGLEEILERAYLRISFKAYVSTLILSLLLFAPLMFIFTMLLMFFILQTSLSQAFLSGIGVSLLFSAFLVLCFYFYPIYRADKLKREIENELAFASGYMAILASAGIPLERIFYLMANFPFQSAFSVVARSIVRDVNLFGLDVISALKRASRKNSSKIFQELVKGLIFTVHSGGDLANYLKQKSKQYMSLKRLSLRKFTDTLATLSEFYVALFVAGPLLLIIMLAVMAVMGGSIVGNL
ncbi:MAG: type II secretion system F family protein, partial [Candidatus Bathyarchaeia archaeon]